MISSCAMILGAGYGKRLLPHTLTTPKPLIEINQLPLMAYTLRHLKKAGIQEVVVNVHHLKDSIKKYLEEQTILKAHFLEEKILLETGGGIKNALPFFKGHPFLVINGDVFFTPKTETFLNEFIDTFFKNPKKAQLALIPKECAPFFDKEGDFYKKDDDRISFTKKESSTQKYIYGGIQLLEPTLFEGAFPTSFSMVDIYKQLDIQNELFGFVFEGFWSDIGTIESLNKTREYLRDKVS